jgi:hypothetical protein
MPPTAEAALRARHRAVPGDAVAGVATISRCSCGASWSDEDLDCPRLETELEELAHHRLDDDGGPAR